MYYLTQRLILRTLEIDEANLCLDYLVRNKDFLANWEPKRNEEYYTLKNAEKILHQKIFENETKKGVHLFLFLKDEKNLIGSISISNILWGAFLSCFLGYKLDKDFTNKGYMTEGIEEVISICFNDYKLHRIEANIIPRNAASIRVVEKLGFEYEGTSKKYLEINGVWEDHHHYVLLNESVEQ